MSDQFRITLLAVMCAMLVANAYYSQPLLPLMARQFRVSGSEAGLVATFTQAGFAAGFLLWLPLADRVPRHRLITALLVANSAAALICALSADFRQLLAGSLLLGLTGATVQIVIPAAVSIMPPERRGHAVGLLIGGLTVGVVLARTLSGVIASTVGWHNVFFMAAAADLVALGAILALLPRLPPTTTLGYARLLLSTLQLGFSSPAAVRLAVCAGLMFASFAGFWAGLPFLLDHPPYGFGAAQIGMFGLTAIGPAILAGRLGRFSDQLGARRVTSIAGICAMLLFAIASLLGPLGKWSLVALVVVGLDFTNKTVIIATQSRVLAMNPAAIGRLNTIFMSCYFFGGAGGAAVTVWAVLAFGWTGLAVCGVTLAGGSLLLAAGLPRRPSTTPAADQLGPPLV